jgi:hypothetical protein
MRLVNAYTHTHHHHIMSQLFTYTDHGNGYAFTLVNTTTGDTVWLQDDDAAHFSSSIIGADDTILSNIIEQYFS